MVNRNGLTHDRDLGAYKGLKGKILADLRRSDLLDHLRKEYVRIVVENGVSHAENIILDKHTFLPGAAMRLLERRLHPLALLRFDDYLSHVFPFSVFARNFGIIARKR